jgi:hypothetical protein
MRFIVKVVKKVDGAFVPQTPFVVDADDASAAREAASTQVASGGGAIVGWVDARLPVPNVLVLEVG